MSLEEQLQRNRQTWRALQEAGVGQGQPLSVDFFFFAPDRLSAGALVEDLGQQGLVAAAHGDQQGWLRRRVAWSVSGTARLQSAELDALDDLVRLLERSGDRHDAEFDGWGAEVDS